MATTMSTRPMYRRRKPKPQKLADFMRDYVGDSEHIDLSNAHLDPYDEPNPLARANELFDARAAAAICDSVGFLPGVHVFAGKYALTEWKDYHLDAPAITIPKGRCLAAMAFLDYFPPRADLQLRDPDKLRPMVSKAIMASHAGWCGTFGPGVDAFSDLLSKFHNGDYEMTQMYLLPIAYAYYEELTPEAREYLIGVLLARGRIHRPRVDDTFTSGRNPEDWSRAGFVSPLAAHYRIGETENHILMILTARYLTNQLLYQRDNDLKYDNRRNGMDWVDGEWKRVGPDCTGLLLILLGWMLRNDFSEYNAKPYQRYTRLALLNLCSYAYDHEVRLAARMVLDYISAHVAVSSNDLRRLVPFRRINDVNDKPKYSKLLDATFMDVALLESNHGADPLVEHFAIQTGQTRAFETPGPLRPWPWGIEGNGTEATMEALSDYRLPPSIHDLFLNDRHRRFFQRLHRFVMPDVELTGRNVDNMEIYAGSPSYLITAGGEPGKWAIDPGPPDVQLFTLDNIQKQLGAAVTTSFMPTGQSAGPGSQNRARDLIQFSNFSDDDFINVSGDVRRNPRVVNYGVAPDFACGHKAHLPGWTMAGTLVQAVRRLQQLGTLPAARPVSVKDLMNKFKPFPPGSVRSLIYKMNEDLPVHLLEKQFTFVNKGSSRDGKSTRPGFYLAFYREGDLTCMEAFDTWLDPTVTFEQFRDRVAADNPNLRLQSNVEIVYRTQNGNRVHFVIWNNGERDNAKFGAKVTRIDYGDGGPLLTLKAAGNDTSPFISGTIMNSPQPGLVEIGNPFLQRKIILDMRDPFHPKRTSETFEVEEAGNNHEVWVNFAWTGPSEGDFFRPFNTLAAAAAAVANGGVIKIMPGSTRERHSFPNNKRIRLVAPAGGVTIGAR